MSADWAELQADDKCDPPELFYVEETITAVYLPLPPSRTPHSTAVHCRICTQLVEKFICVDCINTRSIRTKRGFDSFEAKKEEFARLQRKLQDLVDRHEQWLSFERTLAGLVHSAAVTRNSVSRLQVLVDLKQTQINSLKERLQPLLNERDQRIKSLARVNSLISRLKKLKSSTDTLKFESLKLRVENLSSIRQKRMVAAFNQIFPLQVSVKLKNPLGTDSSTDLADAIADAACTNYVKDRWIFYDGHFSDLQFRLVHSELPDNGDYSPYKHAKFGSPDADTLTAQNFKEYQKALGIPSGLGYAAQLCNTVASILDFPLPFRLGYFNFCGSCPSGNSFDLAVAKLNSNAAVLCLSQGFSVDFCRPLYNLFNLFSNSKGVGLKLTAGPFYIPEFVLLPFITTTKNIVWEEENSEELQVFGLEDDVIDDWESLCAPADYSPISQLSPPVVKSSGVRIVNSLLTSATRLLKTTSSNINGILQ